MAQIVRNLPPMQGTWVLLLGQEDPLEKGMVTHSSVLAWRIPCTEDSGGLQSMGSQESDTAELLSLTKCEFLCFSALFLKENILFEACTTASLEESVVFRIVIWRNKTQM